MSIALEQLPSVRQSVTPQLIEASQILSLSAVELEQAIMRELDRNPALEMAESVTCPRCKTLIDGGICPACRFDAYADDERMRSERELFDRDLERASNQQGVTDDFDPMTLVASDVSPIERLLIDLAAHIDEHDQPIAEYLLHNLDSRGFLEVPLEEIATLFECPLATVERIVQALQQVAPPGVGARSVGESLLLQLDHLERQGTEPPVGTRRVVEHHLEDLASHRYSRVARKLKLTTAQVHEVHAFIRGSLTPSPLQTPDARTWRTPSRAVFVAPDVVVYATDDDDFKIEIVESSAVRLRLEPMYASLASDLRQNEEIRSSSERGHIRHHVSRARLFLLAITQRHETLKRITACLMELQRDYVVSGVRSLRPLTRGQVAQYVGLHESTVSRATAGKYLMLPNREVVPFSTFFSASLSTKDIMREIIEREDRAMTDEEIGALLQSQGIRIARRTVAKYRATLGILPSTYRYGHTVSQEASPAV